MGDKGVMSSWVPPPPPHCKWYAISSLCYGNWPSYRSQALTYRICCIELFLGNSWKQMPCTVSMKPPVRVWNILCCEKVFPPGFFFFFSTATTWSFFDLRMSMMGKFWVNIGSCHWSFSEEGRRYSEQSNWSWWCLLSRTNDVTFPSKT